MAANTEVGTYTVVITASAAGNTNYKSGSKDITMTVTVGKLTVNFSMFAISLVLAIIFLIFPS